MYVVNMSQPFRCAMCGQPLQQKGDPREHNYMAVELYHPLTRNSDCEQQGVTALYTFPVVQLETLHAVVA